MSVELEWELFDIFDSGMFAFPIYDHNSARRIVRYLLMRGIIHEEIAEAIEDSTGDLIKWMNRHGKHKIGEWVIAWVNDMREEFERGDLHKMGSEGGEFDRELFFRGLTPESDDGHTSDGDGGGRRAESDKRSDSRITDLESVDSQAGTSSTTADAHLDTTEGPNGMIGNTELTLIVSDKQKLSPFIFSELPPPPLPPRSQDSPLSSLSNTIARSRSFHRPTNLDLTRRSLQSLSSNEGMYEPPDSGHFSDLYTAIPPEKMMEAINLNLNNNSINSQCAAKLLSSIGCQYHMQQDQNQENSEPSSPSSSPLSCTCSVAHYSYIHNQTVKNVQDVQIPDLPQDNHSYCDIFLDDSVTPAMAYDFQTLDQDGPGYIFIMTDSIANCLPWSSEHRYKIASSRQPDRCLVEFRTRNIEIDLIWQVKVKHHIKAAQEIHRQLQKYNLHSNWFKCSLSLIMDTVSRVVKCYK